eukprot:UN17740
MINSWNFMKFGEKYTFSPCYIAGEKSFRPSPKSLLGFEGGIEIASMGHLGHQTLSLSLVPAHNMA